MWELLKLENLGTILLQILNIGIFAHIDVGKTKYREKSRKS
ncbi:hypothetical protein [Leptospira noguchii]|nr:hypothetical protein [Leptospira noguchii]EKR71302.1 hypothetical protein LEP1GSC041_1666 [Leptospira noguchii str. 2006001870]